MQGKDKPVEMFEIPAYVDLSFDTTVMEPAYFSEGALSNRFKPISSFQEKVYDNLQFGMYHFLAITLGSIFSIVWGLTFGALQFATVWLAHPLIKIIMVAFRILFIVSRSFTRGCFDPCFESLSIMYSRIRGGFHVSIERKPEGAILDVV